MQYIVQEVGDNELPTGVHAVLVERVDGPALMLVNGLPARVWRMMCAWEVDVEHGPTPVPSVRLVSHLGIPVGGVSGWQALARGAV